MKRSLKELYDYIIKTKDGTEGKANDFLFDEKLWIVRYFDADFGNLFSSTKVLIPRVFVKQPLWENKIFPTELTKDDFEKCPKLSDHLPISRKYEAELYKHHRLNPYWTTPYLGSPAIFFPPRPIIVPSRDVADAQAGRKVLKEEDTDSILRSFKEIEGYHINSKDGKIGHIEDLIIDDEDWQIVYAVIDTINWLPWSKKILIAISWIESISYINNEVDINLKTETIEGIPEFQANSFQDKNYEQNLFDFYSRSLVK